MVKRRVFDEAFREMAVDLSYAKGSIQEAARQLGSTWDESVSGDNLPKSRSALSLQCYPHS
ncbi:hypothetical protein SD10_08265 [Spirosoma radiotolerans]|uniref:Transposase n=1 Tax=Spirosoma radiotolerans TaxID=1379870 RepID=A0A0E3ZU10_9BACT|nr:hypothetical protein SD10_08265 [Spirosoma radiotolerans]